MSRFWGFFSQTSLKRKKEKLSARGCSSRLLFPFTSHCAPVIPETIEPGEKEQMEKEGKNKELPETQCKSGIFTPNLPPFHDLHANVPPARTYSFPAPLFQILSARKREREMSQREEEEGKKPCTGET